ncbi:hypothetical protein NPX13_g3454 [Xylaria arbuscula]|uniref:Uncharacterized protein n=1 Tax=Xylaria arbuscula TaxID=114810 RepID=A0A9W8NI79_9PEZI|nr:hypothetical protein NPX13_g3454 [Xylaria arbuscula]
MVTGSASEYNCENAITHDKQKHDLPVAIAERGEREARGAEPLPVLDFAGAASLAGRADPAAESLGACLCIITIILEAA